MLELDFNKSNVVEEIGYVSNDLRIPMNIVWAKDKIDVSGWAAIVMAAISLAGLLVSIRSNKKTLDMTERQIDCQKQQWNDEFYLKYKQQKFIDFRTHFLTIVSAVRAFHKIMGPGIFGIDFFKPQQGGSFIYQPFVIPKPQTPDTLLSESMQATYKFLEFITNEEPFVNEIKWLYADLQSFAQSFAAFLTSIQSNKLIMATFNNEASAWVSHPDHNMRYLYLSHWTKITRDKTDFSLWHAIKNKEFLNDLPCDSRDKFFGVAKNDVEFSYYLCIVNEWIELWKNTIDSVLGPSSEKIKLSNNDGLNLEKAPMQVTIPQYIKITPDNMEL